MPHLRSRDEVIAIIRANGGKYQEEINGYFFSFVFSFLLEENMISLKTYFGRSVKYILSTEEMALSSSNPYKLQFLPDLKAAVEKAQMHRYFVLVFCIDDPLNCVCIGYREM
jgi:hypothetical protein